MRLMKPIAVALTLATTAVTFADTADARHRRGHSYGDYEYRGHRGFGLGTGLALGLGTGLAFGALAAPRYYGHSGYYGYRPGYYVSRPYYAPPVVHYHSSGSDWISYCSRKYRSFNPATGMYLGYDGHYHRCR